jgi:hypothetical protein
MFLYKFYIKCIIEMAVENFETKKLCNCLYQHLWFYAKLARKANKVLLLLL